MHQHILPMFMSDMPLYSITNCGCRHPDRAHCVSCHQHSDKYKIKERSQICCKEDERELDYLFVIDFECTCDEEKRLSIQEIIEFPIVVIDLKQKQIIDRFHTFVRPVLYPTLTAFCTKLTGIRQEQVDAAPTLEEVLKEVDKFLEKYLREGIAKVSVLNDCDSDIRNFLRKETTYKEIAVKPVFKEFIDLRRIFPNKISDKPQNIDHMLACVGLSFEGVKHSGLDDATNIARVALEIAKQDYVYTERLKEHMYPYANPHYYEHLVIIAAQPKMKNKVELGMIAHDLRKGTTLWNNVDRKNVKKQEMKKELFEFLDKVGIDVDNSIICVQGKLENEVRSFFQSNDIIELPEEPQSQSSLNPTQTISSFLPFPLQQSKPTNEKKPPVLIDSITLPEQQEQFKLESTPEQQTPCRQSFFSTYFSLNKISKLAGVPVGLNPPMYNPLPMYQQRYYQSRNFAQFQANKPRMSALSYSPYDQMNNYNNYNNSMAANNDSNQFSKLWNGVKDTNSTVVNRLTNMCSVVEGALQNGFIFSKDFASTTSMKRAIAKM